MIRKEHKNGLYDCILVLIQAIVYIIGDVRSIPGIFGQINNLRSISQAKTLVRFDLMLVIKFDNIEEKKLKYQHTKNNINTIQILKLYE